MFLPRNNVCPPLRREESTQHFQIPGNHGLCLETIVSTPNTHVSTHNTHTCMRVHTAHTLSAHTGFQQEEDSLGDVPTVLYFLPKLKTLTPSVEAVSPASSVTPDPSPHFPRRDREQAVDTTVQPGPTLPCRTAQPGTAVSPS